MPHLNVPNRSIYTSEKAPSDSLEGFELALVRVAVSALMDLGYQRSISTVEWPDLESLSLEQLKRIAKALNEIIYPSSV